MVNIHSHPDFWEVMPTRNRVEPESVEIRYLIHSLGVPSIIGTVQNRCSILVDKHCTYSTRLTTDEAERKHTENTLSWGRG